jgi:ribonuclease-3
MTRFKHMIDEIPTIEARLGYTFNDKENLILAFIHRSFINENRYISEHNERLEFLGDSVLGMLIAEYLYSHLPSTPEGELSYLRSRLVDASSCMDYVQKLNVGEYILLGKGERMNDGRGRDSILADLFEAIVAAIYLDGGLEEAKKFLFGHFTRKIESIVKTPLCNWKALLQDYSQKKHQIAPVYRVLDEAGPDHNKQEVGQGFGTSKKEAQQAAAADAVEKLNVNQF